jgi:tetratricopeptide (TPR) repeat protein
MTFLKERNVGNIVCGILLVLTTSAIAQESGIPRMPLNTISRQEYDYAFGEATKFYLFSNYQQAVNLYNECLKINPNSSAINFQLSRIYMQAGEFELAKQYAKKACQVSYDNKWYLQQLAQTYQVKNEVDSAILVYRQMQEQDPDNLGLIYMIASLFEVAGKYDEALNNLELIESKVGPSKEVAIGKYRIFLALKMDTKALQQLKVALKWSNEEYAIVGMVAEYFREHQQPDSARFYYQQIYPEYENDANVSFSFAEFLLEQKSFGEAESVLVNAMKSVDIENVSKASYLYKIVQEEKLYNLTKPVLDTVVTAFYFTYYDDIRSMSVFSDLEFRLGNYAKSANAIKRIISKDPSNYAAYEQLIFCENYTGELDSVLKYSNYAIVNFPERPVPYLFIGSVLYQKKEYLLASKRMEYGLAISDNDELRLEFYSLLAECQEKLNNFNKSEEYFKKALEIDPVNLGICNNYAYYLSLRSKELEYAERLSKVTIEKEPKNSTYLDTYGWVLYKSGKLRKAQKFIEMAIESGGANNAEILHHYGDILYARGKYTNAIIAWKKALMFAEKEKSEILNASILGAESKIRR